jgi:hypothetical protein
LLHDWLIGHDDSAFKQELFDIAKAQAEPKVQPHGVANDFRGKTMVLIAVGWGCGVHAATLPQTLGV